ncbi:Ger(x)C family spore germination protein [Paenibacillus sp. GYB003]|uniref:Ger(x)C family spore germination protein n=1 Tax=Paenibacillus sp. GYB003 TaxID=2994392 RepID=UPI002F9661EE
MVFRLSRTLTRCLFGIWTASVLILVTGCWSKEELNDRSFVTAVMVDITEDKKTELSIGFVLPNRMQPGQASSSPTKQPYTVITQTGGNLAEAYQLIQRGLSRRITWGSIRVIVIGERYAKAGLEPFLDFFMRIPDIRLRTPVFFYNGKAKEISAIKPVFEQFPSEILREFAHLNLAPEVTLKDMLYTYWSGIGDGFIPGLKYKANVNLTEGGKQEPRIVTDGASIVKRGRAVGKFSDTDTVGILWIMNKLDSNSVQTVLSPTDDKPINVRMLRAKTKVTVSKVRQNLMFHLKIESSGELLSSDSDLNLASPAAIVQLESALSKAIKSQVQNALNVARKHHADTFQWSDMVRKKYPDLWDSWKNDPKETLWNRAKVSISVDSEIVRIGASRFSKPPRRKE